MFNATFYQFGKKKNSTRRPTNGGMPFAIQLLEPCGVLNPTIKIKTNNPRSYNYCYIPLFDRYYFVNEWISDHDFWTAHLSVDVLASWKNSILNSTQFVLRAASKNDPYIVDNFYQITSDTDIANQVVGPLGHPFTDTNMLYVLVISNNMATGKINGSQYLCLTQSELNSFMQAVLSGTANYWDNTSLDITDDILRAIVNPLQYIGSAYCIPYDPTIFTSAFYDTITEVKLGFWNVMTGVSFKAAKNLSKPVYDQTFTLTPNKHPQSIIGGGGHGQYLNGNPFTQITLYAGPFGQIPLDTGILCTSLSGTTTLQVHVTIDINGRGTLIVTDSLTGAIVGKAYADISVPISLTQITSNALTAAGNYIGMISSAVTGNYGNAVSEAANISSSIDNIFPKPQTQGQNGSVNLLFEEWKMQYEFHNITSVDSAVNLIGKPYCNIEQLSDLTGYVQTAEPRLSIACYGPEYDQISAYMQGGFFIE